MIFKAYSIKLIARLEFCVAEEAKTHVGLGLKALSCLSLRGKVSCRTRETTPGARALPAEVLSLLTGEEPALVVSTAHWLREERN